MFEDDDEARIEAARALAEDGRQSAVHAFRAIAIDDGVDDAVRLEAAMLARGDGRWAVQAFRAIAADDGIDDRVRLAAARELARLSERPAGVW